MKTPETYIADRAQRVLTVLDPEDREALQIHIASEVQAKAETALKIRGLWRFASYFGIALGVMGPFYWYLANRPAPIELPSLPVPECPACKACPKPPEPLKWDQISQGNVWLDMSLSTSDKQECISFSNGTVTCIPKFKTPDKVETPAP